MTNRLEMFMKIMFSITCVIHICNFFGSHFLVLSQLCIFVPLVGFQ